MNNPFPHDTDSPVQAALRAPQLAPLQDSLKGSTDPLAVKRMWESIENRQRSPSIRLVWGGSFATALLACVLLFSFAWKVAAPLEFAHGGTLTPEYTAQDSLRVIPLNDGSQIEMHEQAQLSLLSNEGGVFLTAVRSGRVDFHVKPGGERRWVVDAGALSVEVVGTVFSVERRERSASVKVSRGVVRVRGEVPGGEVELRAGDSIEVSTDPRKGGPEGPDASSTLDSEKISGSASPDRSTKSDVVKLSDLPFEDDTGSGDEEPGAASRVVGEEPGASGGASAVAKPTLDALLAQADAHRANGDTVRAAQLLARVVREADSSDPRRGIAALSFARTSGDQVAVASALELGLHSMSGSLREPALTRLLSAYESTGQIHQLRRIAHLYLLEFPSGPRCQLAKKIADRP